MKRFVAILGPTASGKSALGLALAARLGGEIVNCDSTAVYRGLDIGTDKVAPADRHGIPHYLIDIADPTETYTAARYAADAARAVRDIHARGRLPIVVGGTGFYYRALTRGLFPGPARDVSMRDRLHAVAERGDPERLHRWLARVDPASARRIQPRDTKRMVRALEVYLLTGQPLTAHFDATEKPLPEFVPAAIALEPDRALIAGRVARRVDDQFARGIVGEIQGLLAAGVPRDAHAFSGLVYRQVLEMLDGVRDEPATRALIVQENLRYARRQLIWFRKEPNLTWIPAAGERDDTLQTALNAMSDIAARAGRP
ncbi:MAG TPA: tRNA (adenosine(37)-N6)-dimethylallyltransferase MiaA [Vicinamibacterales bacterium]|nr:tRNA (adenosine(37)-N6)-dimethylallyltransferase MiaA [Vicinamibacterales bacterium]